MAADEADENSWNRTAEAVSASCSIVDRAVGVAWEHVFPSRKLVLGHDRHGRGCDLVGDVRQVPPLRYLPAAQPGQLLADRRYIHSGNRTRPCSWFRRDR